MKTPFLLILLLAVVGVPLWIHLPPRILSAQERGQGVRQNEADAEPRMALVIGNSAYAEGPLANPVNDAQDMAATLRQLGFEVMSGENSNHRQMEDMIREFGRRIRKGGAGMFYYAGHGVQVSGANYLIPIGAKINGEAEVKFEAVDVGFVLAQMEDAQNRLNIVILDACRNNPFARSFRSPSRGLASIDAPAGTLIAYATAPGQTASDGAGRNGLYTKELLAAMRAPGLKLEDVFKRVRSEVRRQSSNQQVPWEASSIEGDFYFSTPGVPPTSTHTLSPTTLAPANSFSTELKQMYTDVKNNLIRIAEKMPEESYGFKASPEVRTFGQLVSHVADSQIRTCSLLNGAQVAANTASKTTKGDLVAALKESFDMCDKAFYSLTDAKASEMVAIGQRQRSRYGLLAGMVSHSNEEYGFMAVYLRLKGIVPPSSEGR